MTLSKCPDCGCQSFYVKDPEDPYTLFEFELKEDGIHPSADESEAQPLEVTEETETYCDRCAWHDKFKMLSKSK